jgi:hypothetical protein
MTDLFPESESGIVNSYERIHANSEQTHVHILRLDEDRYVVVATDVDPVDFQPGQSETIAFCPTRKGARKHAKRWMEQNAKGVGSSGSGSRIVTALQKLNEYGNKMQDNQQQESQP